MAAGLPAEGSVSDHDRIGAAARQVPTCRPDDRVDEVAAGTGDAEVCVVVNQAGVVMGALRAEQLRSGRAQPVSDVMLLGPSTFRPSVSRQEMREYMSAHHLAVAIVTRLDGRLIGVVTPEDLV